MSYEKKEKILNAVSRIIAETFDGTEADLILNYLGAELGIQHISIMMMGDIPLMYEMIAVWEAGDILGNARPIIDYREGPDWKIVNPYISTADDILVVDAEHDDSLNSVSKEFFATTGVKTAIVTPVSNNGDYLGMVVYGRTAEDMEWTEEEKSILFSLRSYMYRLMLERKKAVFREYMLNESERLVHDIQDSRNNFISKISGEIRTPVNALMGMISIVRHNADNTDVVGQCVERMEKTSKQLLDALNECVSDGLASTGENIGDKTCFTLGEFGEGILKMIRPLSDGLNQTITLECTNDIGIMADREKLEKVVATLMMNSCMYSPVGTEIELSLNPDGTMGKTILVIIIRDHGMGMSEDIIRKIRESSNLQFDTIGKNSTSFELITIKHVVELMLGSIDMSSEIGKGTSIAISIPVEEVGTQKAQEYSYEKDDAAEYYIGRRILIAEDNVLMAEILATLFGYRGLETDIARNGEEAVELYMSHDQFYYDMIFMDIQMPVMDGKEAAKRIRASERGDASIIPIIALSAGGFEEDVRASMEAGMNAHLTKPVGEQELFDTISTFMI